MRNDKYIEILRNLDGIYNEHIELFYEMLKNLFKADNELRVFAEAYYKYGMPIKEVAQELGITQKEAKRRRQVIIDSLETMSEVFVLEYIEDKHVERQNALLTGNEDLDIEVEIAALRKEISKLDRRKKETRNRETVKYKKLKMANETLF